MPFIESDPVPGLRQTPTQQMQGALRQQADSVHTENIKTEIFLFLLLLAAAFFALSLLVKHRRALAKNIESTSVEIGSWAVKGSRSTRTAAENYRKKVIDRANR